MMKMDFDIGNIFYVILTLVAIFAGLLGKKKKPGGQGTAEQKKKAQPGFFKNLEEYMRMGVEGPQTAELEDESDYQPEVEEDEVLMESHTGPYPEQYSEVFSEPHAESSSEAADSITEEYQRRLKEMWESSENAGFIGSEDRQEPLQVIELDEDDGTDYFEVVKDFNAATAVVYSTIINRLDY